jgi:heavy metal translocating P-type ATPase
MAATTTPTTTPTPTPTTTPAPTPTPTPAPTPEETGALALAALCALGLGIALVAEYLAPLPPMAVTLALAGAYLAGGLPAAAAALAALARGRLDIDLLMVVAALAAAAVGAAVEGAVLLALFAVSGAIETRAMGRATRAVEALMTLRPDTALRLAPDGATEEVAVETLVPGDRVVLRPGARVPVDGRVIAGEGRLDEATVTGEADPVDKGPGAAVHEATVNLDGVLTVEVTRALADSTVARMIRLVTEAQATRAPSERVSDWFGQRYTLAALGGAVAALGIFLARGEGWEGALYRAATLLVAASPCAVVISVPAAILSALSAAARGGVLFKGGAALERLAEVRSFAFDKTGTLTTGRAELTELWAADGDRDAALALFAGIEAQSEHPIAGALRRAAAARGLAPAPVGGVTAHPSEGITGQDLAGDLGEGALWAGNARMLARMGARVPQDPALAALAEGERTLVWLGRGARVLAAATVADAPRRSAVPGLAALRAGGVRRIVMMTGDRAPVARRIGAALGLTGEEVRADLLPGDKVRLVEDLAREGPVAFVGDGVNDAAALARADVGVAMGVAGSEVALQAADVALMSEDLTRLAAAHALALRARRVVRQNLAFAVGAMVVLVSAGLVTDLPLPLAVLGHEGGTLLVVLNGLRLLGDPIRRG